MFVLPFHSLNPIGSSMYFFDAGSTAAYREASWLSMGNLLSGFLSCIGWSERIDDQGIKKCQAVVWRVRVRAFKHSFISKSVVANVSKVVIQTMFTAFYALVDGRFTKRQNVCTAHTLAGGVV